MDVVPVTPMLPRREVIRTVASILGLWPALGAQQSAPSEAAQPDQDLVIRTTSRLVLLDVSVKDPHGGFVTGLTKENFRVFEDRKPQVISQFSSLDVPVTVGIVVDESGSMRRKQSEVVTAALVFARESNPQDEIFVVNFNEKARRGLPNGVPFTDNIEQLRDALIRENPEGRTALYDAIDLSLRQLQLGRQDKKTLVVISDGGDNASRHDFRTVMQDTLESRATIYTVGIFDEDDPEKNPGVLSRLAHATGGEVFFPKEVDEIVPVCRSIAKEIRNRYTIGYIPPAEGKPQRAIHVVASSPEKGKLVVHTRTSYLFPSASRAGLETNR